MENIENIETMEMESLIIIVSIAITAIFGLIFFIILNILKNKSKKSKQLHRRYLYRLGQLFIITICIAKIASIINPDLNIKGVMLTSSALIVAIVGFAAQTAISDIICGFLISINKPFEIGDRIIIDGMEPGIVEDITLRHIVVGIYDDLKIIVPNSQLNTKTVINTSYHNAERRGIHLQFSVSYDTDVQKAMDIIRDCVSESPYTLSVIRNGVKEDSGPVYFLKFANSALILETTIWVTKQTSSYVATTDINLRVNKAFRANGIEIPYDYLNVIENTPAETKEPSSAPRKENNAPAKRHYRTNDVYLNGSMQDIVKAKEVAFAFIKRQRLRNADANHVELLTEEVITLIHNLLGQTRSTFWIEGSGVSYKLHLRVQASLNSKEYKKLIELSSSGHNEAVQGVTGYIFEAVKMGVNSLGKPKSQKFDWNIRQAEFDQNDVSETILTTLAGEIKVSVVNDHIEIIVLNAQ